MKNYRPIIYRYDEKSDGSMVFKILFYEDSSWQFVNVPKKNATLINALIMATRMRHEVLTHYIKTLNKCKTEQDLQNTCIEIRQKISVISTASEVRGLSDEDNLKKVFDDQAGKKAIQKIYDECRKLIEELNVLIENNDCEGIVGHLMNLKDPNNRFLEMGTKRLYELNMEVQKEIEEMFQ